MRRGRGSGIADRGFRHLLLRLSRRLPTASRLRSYAQPILLLALLAAIVWALLSLAAGVELRSFEQHRFDSHTGTLPAFSVAQSFRSPRANLSQVEVELGSYATLSAEGRVRLLTGDGLDKPPVFEARLDKASSWRNPFLNISFPPIAASEGATYTLVLETRDRPLNAAFGVKYNSFDALSSGQMYLDGEPQPGDLRISAYYHYGLTTLWGDVMDALTRHGLLIASWACLLWLPGLALLLYLPNSLSGQQRALVAPGVSALALPVFLLITRALGLHLGMLSMWLLVLLCTAAIAAWYWRNRQPRAVNSRLTTQDIAFWSLLAAVFLLTVATRLLSLRDAPAGMGLDAYHHTLIAEMFAQDGGIPSNYEPYAPLASFTYHYGFHALIAAVAWLTGQTSPTDMLTLMPQAGQFAAALPVLTLTLFAWRVLGDRWAGLAAGTLVGLVSIFPAFYVNWSRYTQGLGLALLPVAWVLLLEALQGSGVRDQGSGTVSSVVHRPSSLKEVSQRSGPYMLAVIGAAGLALTHYRIAMIYAGFAALYLLGVVTASLWRRRSLREVSAPVLRALAVAILALAALSPWLVNLSQNFGTRFVGKDSPVAESYYDLQYMTGGIPIQHFSIWLMLVLSIGGVAWAARRGDLLPILPAITWLLLALWSNPFLFAQIGVRLPYSGYLDVTTLATGVWVPLALLAGYALSMSGRWVFSQGSANVIPRNRLWPVGLSVGLAALVLLGGGAASLQLSAMIDSKPYVAQADLEALTWMRTNLPRDAYVLANPFAFPWDAPPQAIQGSDAGLWAPLVAGVRASVPPIPAYNERLRDPNYLENIRNIIQYEPFTDQPANWEALKSAGVTHIYVGSRGGAISVATLLQSDHARLVFHKDAVWVFQLR